MAVMDNTTNYAAPAKSVRSFVPYLLACLLVEASMLAGVLASPFLRSRNLRLSVGNQNAFARVVRWRQSVYNRAHDPHLGQPAPPLRLFTTAGQPFPESDLRGKKVALVFVPDDHG